MVHTRRQFLKYAATGVIGSTLLSCTKSTKKPNVILIMTDDQGYGDLSCHGNPVLKTPNLDALHGESARLTNFHVSPFCAPTRASLLTGRFSDRTHVRTTVYSRNHLNRAETTMAEFFKASGYHTGLFGKWHLGRNMPYCPIDRGFDQWVGHGDGGTGTSSDFWGNDKMNDTYMRNGVWERFSGFCTDIYFDEAMQFIDKTENEPFFVYLPTNVPHKPWHIPLEWRAPYEGKVPEATVDFFATIARFDENLGRLRRFLKTKNLADNTIIIYLTDNGTSGGKAVYNAGMRGIKGSVYEGGHRVPCFMHWPGGGINQPLDIDKLAGHIDLLPTLIDLCSLNTPERGHLNFDGKSLVPLLKNAATNWPDRTLFLHSQNVMETPVKYLRSLVMTEQWRLVSGEELYDIKADPGQQQDIADQHPAIVADLKQRYERYWQEIDLASHPYPRPIVGSPKAPEIVLYPDAWIRDNDVHTWDQSHIRCAAAGSGFWPIEIETAGRYQFEIRRWPREIDHPITAPLAAKKHDISIKGKPMHTHKGVAIPANRVELWVGESRFEQHLKDTDTKAVFTISLQTGHTHVRAWLVNDNGSRYVAYYVYVKKIT